MNHLLPNSGLVALALSLGFLLFTGECSAQLLGQGGGQGPNPHGGIGPGKGVAVVPPPVSQSPLINSPSRVTTMLEASHLLPREWDEKLRLESWWQNADRQVREAEGRGDLARAQQIRNQAGQVRARHAEVLAKLNAIRSTSVTVYGNDAAWRFKLDEFKNWLLNNPQKQGQHFHVWLANGSIRIDTRAP